MRVGSAGVGGAGLVLAGVLAAAPLYLSSVGAAGLQRQFDERCEGRIGLVLPPEAATRVGARLRTMDDALAGAPGLGVPIETVSTGGPVPVLDLPDGVASLVVLLHRAGATDDVEVVDGPDGDGVWVPDTWAEEAGVGPGDTVEVALGAGLVVEADNEDQGARVPLRVAATYRDLVGRRPPPAWCMESESLRTNARGDPPPPMLLLDDATFGGLAPAVVGSLVAYDRLPVERDGLGVDRAADLLARFELATDGALGVSGGDPFEAQGRSATDLPQVIERSDAITSLVRANVRPVEATAVLAGAALAAAAGLLSVRRRQRELRTRAVRGEGRWRLAGIVVAGEVGAAAAGAVVGAVGAGLAVRAFGPAPDLGATRGTLAASAVVGALVAVVAVGSAAAVTTGHLVDVRVARHRLRFLRFVPWEVAGVTLVLVTGRRLDDIGGAQLIGNEATNVDAWAMAFPMLTAVVGALVLTRPVVLVARRLRRPLGGSDPAAFLAVRRLARDPAAVAVVTAAVALAASTSLLGGALTASAERAIDAKARTSVGADVSVTLAGTDVAVPAEYAGRTTSTREIRGEAGATHVTVLGIDPATFADGAAMLDGDARAVARLAAADARWSRGDPIPAIVVGPLSQADVEVTGHDVLAVEAVDRPSRFPTSRTSRTLVVVAIGHTEALQATTVVLGRGDGDALAEGLAAAGLRVNGVQAVADVASRTSVAAVGWAYAALGALASVVLAVLVGIQLARRSAQGRDRQLAEVFTASMGLSRRRAFVAELIEQGLPVVLGLAVGLVLALVTASYAVADLDSARALPPRASLVVTPAAVLLAVAVSLSALAVVVVGGRRQARRARAAVVLRGG